MSPSPRRRRAGQGPGLALLAVVALVAAACGTASSASPTRSGDHSRKARPLPPRTTVPATPAPAAAANHRMFAYYYLWWDTAHWHARLGPNYPYSANPPPLPATLTGDGCTVSNNYPGNQLTDVASPLFTEDNPQQVASDVRQAAGAGLAGFAVAWEGTGLANQGTQSSSFNRRLDLVVSAVDQLRSQGVPFSLWIAYMSSASMRTPTQMDNDLAYLHRTYGANPAFDRTNGGRPTLIMMGSRKYPQDVLDRFSSHWRPYFYLVGDENWDTWNGQKAADFDADTYYWSSQNPAKNPHSFLDIEQLANAVRASRNPDGSQKQFFSPLAPGYNKVLGGGSGCVPRLGGQTMRALYAGNSAAHPNGWLVISWNEIDEGTYVMPLERYGSLFTDTVRSIAEGP